MPDVVIVTGDDQAEARRDVVVRPGLIESRSTVFEPTISVRSYFSAQHIWTARHFAHLAVEYERRYAGGRGTFSAQHRAYVITAVSEAVAFLEATVNEVLQDATDGHHSYVDDLGETKIAALAAYWESTNQGRQATALEKYTQTLAMCGRTPIPKGEAPYQNVKVLVELRNALTHYRPASISDINPHPLDSKLSSRFASNGLLAYTGGTFYPDHALGAGCAQWAVDTATAFADHFARELGLALNYQQVTWLAEPSDGYPLPVSTAPLARQPQR